MKVILAVALTERNSKFPRFIYKAYNDQCVIPHIGEHVTEYIIEEAHEVVDVEYEYEKNCCVVYLKPLQLDTTYDEFYSMNASYHGWKTSLTECGYM